MIITKISSYSAFLVLLLLQSIAVFSQSDELDKLKSLIDKGNLQKAQTYCDKVTAPMAPKSSEKFFGLMANAYYHEKDYLKAAEMVQKSSDFKLAAKLANEFDNPDGDQYDLEMAITLYKFAKENDKAGELLFGQNKYKESAAICSSLNLKTKYGDSLFNQGKIDESLFYYKRAKNKGQKFQNEKVLNYCYNKKDYSTVFAIQDFNEPEFQMKIQGTVIDRMLENNESQLFLKNFLDSIGIPKNKQDEVYIEAFINNKQFDKAEKYCLEKPKADQQICLSFLADKTAEFYPEISARTNVKLGRTFIAQDQLTVYLIETAKSFNTKWETGSIDKKFVQDYYSMTKTPVEKCGEKYCDLLKFASNKCIIKKDELQKKNSSLIPELKKTIEFLQAVLKVYCK
jgi:hypothetical protein